MKIDFQHQQSAHCENGVITSLLKMHGADWMNEPLAFGMGSGLFYIHIPFLTVNNGPAISFRTMPGGIFKRTCKALGVEVKSKRFRKLDVAEKALDSLLEKNIAVGCQVGVFGLSYFPVEYRFHFNAHNLIVYGKEEGNYLVSDPVMDNVTTLSVEDMAIVRFAKGMYAPKGHIYYVSAPPDISEETIRRGIAKGIRRNVRDMLYIPGNIGGVKGIRYTATQIRKWRDKLGARKAGQHLAQIIRMQEEIGTGGGGFRYIYAAFLEEVAKYYSDDAFLAVSDRFTLSGDLWRSSAVEMAAALKGRASEPHDYDRIATMLEDISQIEKDAFLSLKKLKLA